SNQNQLRKHGHVLLRGGHVDASEPVRSIALWSALNLATAEYGETLLRERYLRIRFEDLCHTPAATIVRVLDFFGLTADVGEIAAREVQAPESLGRWRSQDSESLLRELHHIGGPALERFGYRPSGGGAGHLSAPGDAEALRDGPSTT